jgi:hypothetical protein
MKKFTITLDGIADYLTKTIGEKVYSDDNTYIIITNIVRITIGNNNVTLEGYGMPINN